MFVWRSIEGRRCSPWSKHRAHTHLDSRWWLILAVDIQERERAGIALLDALGERLERLREARLLGFERTNVLVTPQIAPAELVALAEVNKQAAAYVRGLGHRHEIAQRHAILGAEALSARIAGSARHIVEEVLALLDQRRGGKEAQLARIVHEPDQQLSSAAGREEITIVGRQRDPERQFELAQLGIVHRCLLGAPAPGLV